MDAEPDALPALDVRQRYRDRGRGDHVLLPENWLSRTKDGPGHWVGVVTELGTTFTGALASVVDRAPRRNRAMN